MRAKFTARLLASLNAIFGFAGIIVQMQTVHGVQLLKTRGQLEWNFNTTFYAMMAIDFVLLSAQIWSSVYVWRIRRTGLIMCNAIFVCQIISYYVLYPILVDRAAPLGPIPSPARFNVMLGGMGVALQMVVFYPFIALGLLNFVYRRLERKLGDGQHVLPSA
jgi:hypothetical protein